MLVLTPQAAVHVDVFLHVIEGALHPRDVISTVG